MYNARVPQPSVRELRATFDPESRRRSHLVGLAVWSSITLICGGLFFLLLWLSNPTAKLACGAALGVFISALFAIGHDACHDSLTPSHRLNQLLGRLSFLPTLHPFTCWELGHNRLHHGSTNLKGVDYVYTPFSPGEFAALPAWRRWLEKIYRTVPGIGLFYFVEIWWKHMIVPRASDHAKMRRALFALDLGLVTAFLAGVIAVIVGRGPGWREIILNVACAVVLPYAIWNWLMAFVTIQHHTHPASPWFKDPEQWSFFHGQVHGTVHLRLPRWMELIFHNILDHTAHHVDPKIPLYRLHDAQRHLEEGFPGEVIVMQGSIPALHRVLRACKLYDYDRHCWLNFKGQPSAPPIPMRRWSLAEEVQLPNQALP
jgi:omega-6 fatty acid desaturase (delta-12 desaturase)